MNPSKCMIRRGAQIVWPASSKCEPTVAWLLLSILGGAPNTSTSLRSDRMQVGLRESLLGTRSAGQTAAWGTVLTEKLTVSQLMKIFSAFYGKAIWFSCSMTLAWFVCVNCFVRRRVLRKLFGPKAQDVTGGWRTAWFVLLTEWRKG